MKLVPPRIIFLFSSTRHSLITAVRNGMDSDMGLYGLNHLPDATYIDVEMGGDFLSPWLARYVPRGVKSLLLLPRLLRYDFVIASDELSLGYLVSMASRAFRLKTRWLYVAMNSSTLLRRHASHPVRKYVLKLFWKSYFRIVCISNDQLEDFVRCGIPRTRLVFVPFGIDANFFQPTSPSLEEDLIVSVGRDLGRDYPTLFKAAGQTDHAFVVVAAHRNIAPDVPVPANVSVLYNQSLVEIRNLYVRARMVVVVSKDVSVPEGSDCSGQTVILDALAAGKPVIATRRPWIADYLVSGRECVIVEPNNPDALAREIEALWRDAGRRKRLAHAGREKVLTRYTTKQFASALEKLLITP